MGVIERHAIQPRKQGAGDQHSPGAQPAPVGTEAPINCSGRLPPCSRGMKFLAQSSPSPKFFLLRSVGVDFSAGANKRFVLCTYHTNQQTESDRVKQMATSKRPSRAIVFVVSLLRVSCSQQQPTLSSIDGPDLIVHGHGFRPVTPSSSLKSSIVGGTKNRPIVTPPARWIWRCRFAIFLFFNAICGSL